MGGHYDSITWVNKPQQHLKTCLRSDSYSKWRRLLELVRPHSLYIITYMTEAHRTMISFSLKRSVAFESLMRIDIEAFDMQISHAIL